MLSLARPYRQALATLAILLLTVLPTLYVGSLAWRIRRPGHVRDTEVELGRRLGLQVSLESVWYPRPGVVVYRGVVVRQEEPRRHGLTEIARAQRVRLVRSDREVVVETEGLRLRGESPRLAMGQVGALLQRSLPEAVERVSLTAPTCRLDLGDKSLRFDLRDLAGAYQSRQGVPTLHASYRLIDRGASTRCELVLARDRTREPVRTTLAFKTMDGLPLPARVLNLFFDSERWLGAQARMEGSLTLRQTGARDWEADFQGDLHDVDLATLVGQRFSSHRLSGLAHVAIRSARWGERPGQGVGWIEGRGELTTRHGTISRSLVAALGREMRFRVVGGESALQSLPADLEFRALGLRFAMRPDGEIELGGALGNEFAPDAVLAGRSRPLAYAPLGAANVRGLIKTLVPTDLADPVMVPLTDESRILMCFPAPAPMVARRIEGN
jgi:hypothetical protein